jgi:hypothetical protein
MASGLKYFKRRKKGRKGLGKVGTREKKALMEFIEGKESAEELEEETF